MDSVIKRLAIEQRRRLIASVMNAVESEQDVARRRERVIGSINVYHDFLLDIIKVGDEDGIRNEEALALIAQVHASQRRMEMTSRNGG